MRVTIRIFFSIVVMLYFACGCNKKLPESATEPTDERTNKTDALNSSFELTAHPADSYSVGKKANFSITLKPQGEYYINQQYPTSVTTSVPKSIALEKPKLLKADAMLFSKQQAKFEVAFTPSEAGEHEVNALVGFAVCTKKTCTPLQKNLSVLLKVN